MSVFQYLFWVWQTRSNRLVTSQPSRPADYWLTVGGNSNVTNPLTPTEHHSTHPIPCNFIPTHQACISSPSKPRHARLSLNLSISQTTCLCTSDHLSLPFIFKHYPLCPRVRPLELCCTKQMAMNLPQGDADVSIGRKGGRKEEKRKRKKSWGKGGGKNCETPMCFISSYIIHFEMHLGWCKSVQRHPLFQAFTLKCLCGWSVLRQFGPTSLPHPQP